MQKFLRNINVNHVVLLVVGVFVAGFLLQRMGLVEGFVDMCRAKMPVRPEQLAQMLLPQSTPTVVVTPTVPLVLPKSELPLRREIDCGRMDCTSDLECIWPLKCCGNKCVPATMVDQFRGLYVPQRVRVCSSALSEKERPKTLYSGAFEDIQGLSGNCNCNCT